ncbi:hypothetical protein [Flavobacterium sp. XS2P24]|uniref:hypothetical protein n=1 Tax=Flavobacterium sp. XS2P24 TaxID=3041249 RepID=UPI0024A9FDD4|nr:hypothetical protein [Flavobacterium sp. XS2P24]
MLKKVVETSENGTSETTVYTYNGTEIVSIDGTEKRTDFTYTDGLITKRVILNKTNQLSETIEYSYLVGKLVEVESLGNYRINYIHNSDKTVSYERFRISGNQQVKEFHGALYFENENLIKNERILDTMPVGITSSYSVSFDYDAKNNPLYNVLGYKNLLDHMETISSNNSLINTVIAITTNGDQVLSVANFYKSSFKYDSDNYPTEQVSETVIFAKGNTGYLKTQYFYE